MSPRQAAAIQFSAFARAFGDIVLFAYLPLYLYAVVGEQRFTVISLILAVPNLLRFLGARIWGAAVDRTGRSRLFLLVGMGAYVLAMGAILAAREPALAVLMICALAVPGSAYNPTARSYLTRWPDHDGRTLGGWLRAETAGWLAGGLAMSAFAGSHPAALPITAASLAAGSLAALSTLPEPPDRRPGPHPTPAAPGSKIHPLVRHAALFVGLTALAAEAVFAVFGIYLTEILRGPAWLYGAAITGSTVAGLLLYGPVTRAASSGRAATVLAGAAAGYTLSFGLALVPNPWVVAVAFVLPMFAAVRAATTCLAAAASTEDDRGRAMGLIESSEALAVAMGSLGGGLLADALGVRAVIAAALALSLVLLPVAMRIRKLAPRPAPAGLDVTA